jgi:hypothetical protein
MKSQQADRAKENRMVRLYEVFDPKDGRPLYRLPLVLAYLLTRLPRYRHLDYALHGAGW